MARSVNSRIIFVRRWVDEGEEVRKILDSDGAEIIGRIMGAGKSLRSISRKTGLSPTYLSMVLNRKARISPSAYLTLCTLDTSGK